MDIVEKKKIISIMKEKEFKGKLLIPLFYQMDFKEVVDFHGGSLEKGKDIIFWKNDEFSIRQNYGVVVKAGDITGKVGDYNSGMPTIFNQLQQTLLSKFISNTDGREYEITRVILATTGKITKEAMESVSGQLKKLNLNKLITFISIDNILGFIDEHLPTFFKKDDPPYKELAYAGGYFLRKIKSEHPEYDFPPEADLVIGTLFSATASADSGAGLGKTYPYIVNTSGNNLLSIEDLKKYLPPEDEIRFI